MKTSKLSDYRRRVKHKKCSGCGKLFDLGKLTCHKSKAMCRPCSDRLEDVENKLFFDEVKAVMDVLGLENEYCGYKVAYNEERKDVVDVIVPDWHYKQYYWGFFSGLFIHTILANVPHCRIWHINKQRGKPLYVAFHRADNDFDRIAKDMPKNIKQRRESRQNQAKLPDAK